MEGDCDLAVVAVVVDPGDEPAKDPDLVSRRQRPPLRLKKDQRFRRGWVFLFRSVFWMGGSEGECFVEPGRILAQTPALLDQETLDLGGRERLRRARVPAPLLGLGTDVVAIAWALACIGRRHG